MLSSRLRINGSSSTTIKGLGRMDSVGREKVSAILYEVPLVFVSHCYRDQVAWLSLKTGNLRGLGCLSQSGGALRGLQFP
ncbi:hypothetical protein SDC9_160151 [bioreactor metagenome]|uniref:Uncharacterized protein n=1 Tax=bioreactor metagenome TaxID=1076179 RepID=A0A645FEM5_9ZZZZ